MATWADIRSSIREHLWRDSTVLPDALVQTHMIAAMRFIEAKRNWHWLEEVKRSSTAEAQLAVPADLGRVISLSVDIGTNAEDFKPLRPVPLTVLRSKWPLDHTGEPELYARHGDNFFLAPAPDMERTFELVYRKKLEAVDGNSNIITDSYPLALVYRACHTIAAGHLKDDGEANRFALLFETEIARMEDEDDDARGTLLDGMIEPDDYYHCLANGANR